MKRLLVLFAGMLLSMNILLKADEGMWILTMLNELNMGKMTEMGLELSAEEIYNLNNSSLKDAIGALDYGSCTSSLISPDGLLLTNHHCAYGEIQYHSSVTNDYLSQGFWARTREEELPNTGKTISFVVRIEDVTEDVLSKVDKRQDGMILRSQLESITKPMVEKATEGTHYEASVKSFFNGNKYYLVVLETFKDVRLVGRSEEHSLNSSHV